MGLALRGSNIRAVGGLKARDGGSGAQEFLECSVSLHAASDLVRPPIGLILWSSRMEARDRLWAGAGDSEVQRFSLCPPKALDSDKVPWELIPRDTSREDEGSLGEETGSAETQRFSLLCLPLHGVSDLGGTHLGLVP